MKNNDVRLFWMGFAITAALSAWIYWIWRQKRVVAPEPLIVSRNEPLDLPQKARPAKVGQRLMVSEPLEEINGIGPTYANRLNEAGIYTFAQLATTPPSELQQITGVTRWDPADWIAEAKELAGTR